MTMIAEIQIGAEETVRITKGDSHKRDIQLRIWFKPRSGGEPRPSKAGLSIPAHKLDAVIEALRLGGAHDAS